MIKHTPGPWRVGKVGDQYIQSTVVADSEIGTHGGADNVAAYGGHLVCESIKTEDNARLISCAPELIQLIQEIVAASEGSVFTAGLEFGDRMDGCAWIENARHAIDKAEWGA